jgi:hypothetical protein
LEALGPIAKPCLPELIALTGKSTGYCEAALMAVGPDALPAFTNLLANSKFPQTGNLIGALANSVYADRIKPEQAAVTLPYLVQVFRSSDTHGGWYAAQAFGALHQQPELCVPLLVDGLTNSTASFRAACVQSLGAFGAAANPHAQRLADMFDQTDHKPVEPSAMRLPVPILLSASPLQFLFAGSQIRTKASELLPPTALVTWVTSNRCPTRPFLP